MADAEKTKAAESDAAEAAPPKKSQRKLIIFIVIGVVVLAVAGAGAFLMLKKNKSADAAEGAETAEAAHEDKNHEQPPVYVKLESFTTNLTPEGGDQPSSAAGQYIQVVVEMKVEDAKAGEELKNYMPEIRNNILRLLSARKASQLSATEGKDLLASEIRDNVNAVINPGEKKPGKPAKGPVQSVLFSSFIIQ